jgi:hypothetical protein
MSTISQSEREPLRRRFVETMTDHGVPAEVAEDALTRYENDLATTFYATALQLFNAVAGPLNQDQRNEIIAGLVDESSRTADPQARAVLENAILGLRPPRGEN